jgi:hypothetical protein
MLHSPVTFSSQIFFEHEPNFIAALYCLISLRLTFILSCLRLKTTNRMDNFTKQVGFCYSLAFILNIKIMLINKMNINKSMKTK